MNPMLGTQQNATGNGGQSRLQTKHVFIYSFVL